MNKNSKNEYTYQNKVIGLLIFVLGGAELLTVLDGTVVALALPEMTKKLSLTSVQSSWVVTSYVIAFAGFLLLGGKLGDTFSRKKLFIFGISILSLASLISGFAQNFETLMITRFIQGMGAAVSAPTAFSLLTLLYKPGKMRSLAVAIYGSMMGIGSMLGLSLGGIMASIDWRFVFWINVPIGFFIVLGGIFFIPNVKGEGKRIDFLGSILVVILAFCYVISISAFSIHDFSLFYKLIVTAIICSIIFIIVEIKTKDPILPFTVFKNKNRTLALISTSIAGSIMTCMAIFVAMYLQDMLGYTPLQSGFAVMPFAVGMGIAMVVSPILATRIAPRWIIIFAGSIMLVSFIYASRLVLTVPKYFPTLAILIVINGIGVGLAVTPLLLSVMAGLKPKDVGVVSSLQKAFLDMGSGVGLTFVSAFQVNRFISLGGKQSDGRVILTNSLDHHNFGLSLKLALEIVAVLAVLCGLVVLFMNFTTKDVSEGLNSKSQSDAGLT